ncbi:hypothetical protein D3C76_1385350 [compost metagenome]
MLVLEISWNIPSELLLPLAFNVLTETDKQAEGNALGKVIACVVSLVMVAPCTHCSMMPVLPHCHQPFAAFDAEFGAPKEPFG